MSKQITPTVERLVIRPLRDLLDTTFLLITSPASVAREFASQDGHQFARAVTYFVAAFSAGVILENIAAWSLGVDPFAEFSYWAINGFIFLCIAVLAVFLAFVLGSSPPSLLLKSACLAFGACTLIGSFLIAGASLTLAGLHKVGYIPDFIPDPTSFENYMQIGKQAYLDCLREQSMLFGLLFDGLGDRYERLKDPIDEISWVWGVLFIVAWVLFAVLAFFGTERRRWAAAVAASLSVPIVIGVAALGLKVWSNHLEAITPCQGRMALAAEQATAEDQVRHLAKMFEGIIGRTLKHGATVTDVGHRGKSVILRLQTPTHAEGVEGFKNWADRQRRTAILDYCSSNEKTTYWRKLGLSFVWVYRYADTDLAETVLQSPDQCTR